MVRTLLAVGLALALIGSVSNDAVDSEASSAAAELAGRFKAVADNVAQAHVLQGVLDGQTVGAQSREYSVPATLMRQQAALVAVGLVKAAPSLLKLRDAAAARVQTQSVATPPAMQSGSAETLRDLGIDADLLNKAGVLREASLDADIQALDPNDTPPPGPVWSAIQSKGTVNLASSMVTMPQYCLRIGIPNFGSAYSDAFQRGDVAEGVLGGLAPRDGEGQYPCVTRRGKTEQQSLDRDLTVHCLTRQNVRVLTCGSSAELADAVRFLNASATLDDMMRALVLNSPSEGLIWQRIAHARMGVERSYPGTAWTETSTEGYERYDARLAAWFAAAASAPRALVIVLDCSAAMEDFDRRDIGLRVASSLLRSLGPADLVALVAAGGGEERALACSTAPQHQACAAAANLTGPPAPTAATAAASGQRLCATNRNNLERMLAAAAAGLNASAGICDMGQAVVLALNLLEAEVDAWAKEAGSTSSGTTAGAGTEGGAGKLAAAAKRLKMPRLEVVVVGSAIGWAPPDSVRARLEEQGVGMHAVSLGALASEYERSWLRRLACGAAKSASSSAPSSTSPATGALSHIAYRYIWQQVVGGWYRLAARKRRLPSASASLRLVAVSALHLSTQHGFPVLTLSAAFHELLPPAPAPSSASSSASASAAGTDGRARVAGVVALDVAPGPVLMQVGRDLAAFLGGELRGKEQVWWDEATDVTTYNGQSAHADLAEVWLVEASGAVLAHPALPLETQGFTNLAELEGAHVYETLFGRWRAGVLLNEECIGPILFNSSRIPVPDSSSSSSWQVGRAQQRAAFMIKVGGEVEHLDAVLLVVFSGDAANLEAYARGGGGGGGGCGSAVALRLTMTQPGFPAGARSAASLVHHESRQQSGEAVAVVRGSDLEPMYRALGTLTLACSVYAVSSPALETTGGGEEGGGGSDSGALDALTAWLLVANVSASGEVTPGEGWEEARGYLHSPRAVRDILATAALDAPWRRAWAERLDLGNSTHNRTGLLPTSWRFVTAATESGTLRIFPGVLPLPKKMAWSSTESYIRSVEAGHVAVSLSGPYLHPLDGAPTVAIATVVWEQNARARTVAGVVAAEFTYAAFLSATLHSLHACDAANRWCMLLDRQAGVLAVTSASWRVPAAEETGAQRFLGEIEPLLARALEAAGLLVLAQASVRSSSSSSKGEMRGAVELRLNPASGGAVVESVCWDGQRCRGNVSFALQAVSDTNVILLVADASKSRALPCPSSSPSSAPLPVTRAAFVASLASSSSSSASASASASAAVDHTSGVLQCGATRSRTCDSCYLAVKDADAPDAIPPLLYPAGEVVVGSDAAQWVREVGEVGGDQGGGSSVDECVMPTSTLVRAHEGDVAEGTCVWWRRRAGWC